MTFTPHTLDRELDLELEREVAVPPAQVWAAWTTPELVKQWFAPKPFETPDCEIDLRPGGAFRTVMRSPDGDEFDNTGCFLEIIPEERLVFTTVLAPGFRPQASDLPFTAIIELEATPSGGTHYRALAVHGGPDARKQHEDMGFLEGWSMVLDQLVEVMQQA